MDLENSCSPHYTAGCNGFLADVDVKFVCDHSIFYLLVVAGEVHELLKGSQSRRSEIRVGKGCQWKGENVLVENTVVGNGDGCRG